MSWRDTIRPSETDKPSGWRSTIAPITEEQEPIDRKTTYGPDASVLEGLGYGFGQGVTLDNLDEILARGKSMFGEGNYEQYLEEERKRLADIEEGAPISSTVGRIGGYAVPGMGAARLLKPATGLARAGIEAGMGAVQGLGAAEDTGDIPQSVLTGAGIGAAGSGAIDVASKAARYGLGKLGDVAGLTIFSTPTEVTQALRQNPRALEGAKETSDIADILAQRLQGQKRDLGTTRKAALDTLGDSPLQNKEQMVSKIESLANEFGATGVAESYPGSQAILSEIKLARDAILNSQNEREIKNILARLDERADFSAAGGNQINAVRKQIRGIVDSGLKQENPAYAEAMKPLAEQTRNYKRGLKEAKLERGIQGLQATDRTTQRLETLMNQIGKSKGEIARTDLETVYPEIIEELRKQRLLRQSEGGVTTGSRNVLLGGGSGAVLDAIGATGGAGAASGLLAGAFIDRYGRTLGSLVAKNSGRAGRFLDKFGDYFKGAANKELTHQFLMSVDPEYEAMVQELETNEQ